MKNFYVKQNATDLHNVGDLVIAYADSDDMCLNEYSLILVLSVLRRANGMTNYTLFGIQNCTRYAYNARLATTKHNIFGQHKRHCAIYDDKTCCQRLLE